MLKNKNIVFIGSGTMAEAMIKGLLSKELLPPENIIACDILPDRTTELAERYGVGGTQDNVAAAALGDIVVLAVKPQYVGGVLEQLSGVIKPEALVLSIVAGTTIERITKGLVHPAVIRVMPNTPAQIGMGMSVWTTTPATTKAQCEQARMILSALGEEIHVEREDYLDMATALSGTGPAYVFLVMEALIDAGVHMGFSRPIAQKLVLQTMGGSVGTSAEALYQLEKGGLRTIVSKAVWAAYQKSKYLGGLSK
jgi:pyrroline-5-carboxylate reductase